MYSRKPSNAALAAQERRRREDNSPRISDLCPELVGLKITVEDRTITSNPKYIRRIVVGSAPALFLLPCGDPHCSDGGHDITADLLSALRSKQPVLTGTRECNGSIGSSPCRRTIWFEAQAEYSGAGSKT